MRFANQVVLFHYRGNNIVFLNDVFFTHLHFNQLARSFWMFISGLLFRGLEIGGCYIYSYTAWWVQVYFSFPVFFFPSDADVSSFCTPSL